MINLLFTKCDISLLLSLLKWLVSLKKSCHKYIARVLPPSSYPSPPQKNSNLSPTPTFVIHQSLIINIHLSYPSLTHSPSFPIPFPSQSYSLPLPSSPIPPPLPSPTLSILFYISLTMLLRYFIDNIYITNKQILYSNANTLYNNNNNNYNSLYNLIHYRLTTTTQR